MNNDQAFTTNLVTVNGTEYRLLSLSYDGAWYNVIKTATGEPAYLNADTVEQAGSKYDDFPTPPPEKCYVL